MSWIRDFAIIISVSLALLFACLEVLRFHKQANSTKTSALHCGAISWPSRFTELAGISSFKPGATLRHTNNSDFCAESPINSLGHPDHEPVAGDSIILLGDSFVEQAQLSLSQKNKLQDKLRELYLERHNVQKNIIAIGHSGTGQTAQAMMLKEALNNGVTPRDIVLIIVINDVRDNSNLISSIVDNSSPFGSPRPYYVENPNNELQLQPPVNGGTKFYNRTTAQRIMEWFFTRYEPVFGYEFKQQVIHGLRLFQLKTLKSGDPALASIKYFPKQYDLLFGTKNRNSPLIERAWRATEKSIIDIKEICSTCRIQALFTYQFSHPEFSDYRNRFAELLTKHGINYSIQSYDKSFHWKNDEHWNVKGVTDAAELIYSLLDGEAKPPAPPKI